MLQRTAWLLSLVIVPIALTGCGLLAGDGRELSADLNPTQIGFEVDASGGVEIFANNVTFRNQAGAKPAIVTGYEVQIFDESGSEFLGIGTDLFNFHLAIDVPAGYVCEDGETQNCVLGERIWQAMFSETQPFVFLDGPSAIFLLEAGLNRARAEVTFHARQGNRPVQWTESVTVTYPVDGE